MSTDDRRVRKTKKALQEALAAIMAIKELRNITIRELTDKADVHRATFYAHYKDIYDLYEQLENAMIDEISKIIVVDPSHTYEELFNRIIDYVYDNSKIWCMFLKNSMFHERISNLIEEKYFHIWQYERAQGVVSGEWRFLARYHIQGCLAIVRHWSENDYAYPKDKLIDLIIRVDDHLDEIIEKNL